MKYLYIPLVMLLMLTSCADEKKAEIADRSKTDWAAYKLKGDVRSFSEKSFDIRKGNKPGNEIPTQHDTDYTFDENGKLITLKQFNTDGSVFEETTFNGKDKQLKRTQYMGGQPTIITENMWDGKVENITFTTRRNPDNTQIDRIEHRFENGKLAETLKYDNQNLLIDRTGYTYDDKGNLINENLYMGTLGIKVVNKYLYNDKGQKTSVSQVNGNKITYRTDYTYEGDKLIKEETFNPEGKAEYTVLYKFDANGNLAKNVKIDGTQKTETEETFAYDKNRNITTQTITVTGQPVITTKNEYDKNGNITKTHTTNSEGKTLFVRQYEYQYDNVGNWTNKKVIIDSNLAYEIKRTYYYFGE